MLEISHRAVSDSTHKIPERAGSVGSPFQFSRHGIMLGVEDG
jgi:hypothetical protein